MAYALATSRHTHQYGTTGEQLAAVAAFLLIEAVRQLRCACGAGQIADCETAIAHGNGGVLPSQSTVILGISAAS